MFNSSVTNTTYATGYSYLGMLNSRISLVVYDASEGTWGTVPVLA